MRDMYARDAARRIDCVRRRKRRIFRADSGSFRRYYARPDQASPGTSASAQPDTAPSDTPISSRSSVVSDNSSDGSSNSNAAGDSGNIPILNSFDGTNTDGTLNPNQTSANLAENNSKYNGMSTVPIPGAAKSRYSNTRVALSPDIADTKYEEAAELLGALGIMVGDAEDGAFRPNDNILRSEMAKVAVYTVGLEDVVKSSTSPTKFRTLRPTTGRSAP